jgi:hypothetical protein
MNARTDEKPRLRLVGLQQKNRKRKIVPDRQNTNWSARGS